MPSSPNDTSGGSGPLIAVVGIFVADATFRGSRQPRMGETLLASAFALGPGGKGSNQAVAAAKAGGRATMITRLGDDAFADMAERVWAEAGVEAAAVRDGAGQTGAASIFVDEATGDNAISVAPGAGGELSVADIEAHAATIEAADVLLVQLEQPLAAARRALEIARAAGTTTILNPAPAADLPDAVIALCDFLTPNESEAERLAGCPVTTPDEAGEAARRLLARGAGAVVVTLGAQGALLVDGTRTEKVLAPKTGRVVETTGAGDAFNGAFAVGLGEGMTATGAMRFGCLAASISVTRPGAAASSPVREEIDRAVSRGNPVS